MSILEHSHDISSGKVIRKGVNAISNTVTKPVSTAGSAIIDKLKYF